MLVATDKFNKMSLVDSSNVQFYLQYSMFIVYRIYN